MKIEEKFKVNAPIARVWDFILNVREMSACIPGVLNVDVIDDKSYRAVVKQKVGFISATFEIKTEVKKAEPPHSLELSSSGKTIDGAKGTLRSNDRLELRPVSRSETEVTFYSDLTVGGQLGTLGANIIKAKSRELVEEITRTMSQKIEGRKEEAVPWHVRVRQWLIKNLKFIARVFQRGG